MLSNWEDSKGAKRELMFAKAYQKVVFFETEIKNYCANCFYNEDKG